VPSAGPLRVQLAVSRLQRGGLEEILLEVARGLGPRGFEFRVLALRGPGERDSDFREAGIPVEVLGGLASAGPAALPANLACFAAVVRALRAWRPHLLQTHHFFSGVLGRTAGLFCRTPALLQAEHNFYEWKGPLARLLDRTLARLTGGFVTPSRAVADHVSRTHGVPAARVVVVPNGLAWSEPASRAQARARLGLPPGGPIVGFVGRLVPSKRPLLFLDAAAALASASPGPAQPPLFAMLGDGPLRADCEARVARLGLGARVRLLGSVPGAGSLMAAFDLLVACSSEEGFGLAVSEAVLARVPVVAVDLPAFREVLAARSPEQFVAPADAGALARAVASTLAGPARAAEVAERDREALLPVVSVPAMLDRYEALYRALVSARASPALRL
jgi:glycosyltransferase involved in cell wall biosynthesis